MAAVPAASLNVEVADGGDKWPASKTDGFFETRPGSLAPDIVIELGKRRQYSLHQLAGRSLVDRFRY
jgi:hypothetical protein